MKIIGPVWTYWAFPMERYCARLQPTITNRRFPYSTLDRFVLHSAQLTQCEIVYNLTKELSLKGPDNQVGRGQLSNPLCKLIPLLNAIDVEAHILLFSYKIRLVFFFHHDGSLSSPMGLSAMLFRPLPSAMRSQ
jgi:hypothetical protein